MRLFARLAVAAAVLAASTSLAAAWSFGNLYQEKAMRFCAGTSECSKAFPDVPAGKVLQVRHFSCSLVADEARQTKQLFLRLKSKTTAEVMMFQQPVTLKAKADGNNWWVVDGTEGFFIPPDATIEIVYTGTGGSLVTKVDCILAGVLTKAP